MIAWALRSIILWGGLCFAAYYGWEHRAELLALAEPPPQAAAAIPAKLASKRASNLLTYRADRNGHYLIEASVNGAPVRFLLDTGASFVTLTPEDASAAGLRPGDLHYSLQVATANGATKVAPVKLREVRLQQFSMEEVPAVVVETPLHVSLLGMSFLKRLDRYEMRDGELTISW